MAKKFYGIWINGENSVVQSWEECQKAVRGVSGAQFRGFDLESDARKFRGYSNTAAKVATTAPKTKLVDLLKDKPTITLEEKRELSKEPHQNLPEELIVYTDGSCFNAEQGRFKQEAGKRYPGGYAAVFLDMNENELMRISGGEQYTTNNRMELTAVKEALQCLEDGKRHKVHLISDSQYVVNSFSKGWVRSWKRAGTRVNDEITWKKAGGMEEVKNQDLLKSIDKLQSHHEVDFNHTKAHVGTKYNELCDQLAKSQSELMNRVKSFAEMQRAQKEVVVHTKENQPERGR